jgi:hypothetical protein
MGEPVPNQAAASGDGTSVQTERVGRDQLMAGVVLARAIITGSAPAGAAWQAVADFHTAVVRPLIDERGMPEAARSHALSWARALGGPAALDELVNLALGTASLPAWTADVPAESLILDLMELAELMRSATGAPPPSRAQGPEMLIDGPGGEYVILALHGDNGTAWQGSLGEAERAAAYAAVQAELSELPQAKTVRTYSDQSIVCWPPNIAITSPGTALPMALWWLSEIAGLDPPGLSIGHFNGATFSPILEQQLNSAIAAAHAVGRDLLVPTAAGWRCISADGTRPREISAPRTLEAAASIVWGDDWARWKRAAHAEELARLGWHFVDWRQTPTDQPIPDHKVQQVDQLAAYCLGKANPGSAIFLGGTAQSGRSIIVRQLAALLSRRSSPWHVQVITGPTRGLPDRYEAVRVARHALASAVSPAEQAGRRLLVFEDLQPVGEGNASEVLRYVAEQLHVLVLGVLEWAENSPVEWDTDNTFVATAVLGSAGRKRFVEDLAAANSELDPAPALEALGGGQRIDLRSLTKLMSGGTSIPEGRRARFAELSQAERTSLLFTAAVSLVSGEVGEDELSAFDRDDLQLFGIGPGRRPSTVRIPSEEDCVALFELRSGGDATSARQRPGWRAMNSAVAEELKPELARLLRAGDPMAAERLHGARLFHQDLCRSLLKSAANDESLDEWAATAPVMSVIRLTALVHLMSDAAAQRVIEQLVLRACHGTQQWPPDRLLALMHACQQYEFLLSDEALEDLILWLVNAVDRAVREGAGRPDERFALLAALDRLNRENAAQVIAERALDVLTGLTVQVEDYLLVQRVDELQRRAAHRAPEAPLFPVDQENPVRVLLERKPDPADGVGVLLETLNLRRSFSERGKDFMASFSPYENALNQALRSATAWELARALQGIRFPFPQLCTWLLWHWKDFPFRAREILLRSAGATDAAVLLNAVARSSIQTAARIIDDQPDYVLASVLAKRAREANDAKGIGELLSSAQSIDDIFKRGTGFSFELAEAFGEDSVYKLIRHDPRISVRYYIIKGVWDAQASYRREVLDEVLTVVVDSMRRSRKHWGPEIALRLALDPEIGVTFLAELRDRVSPETLLDGMTSAITAHGRALFHRLGRALHPDIPIRFREQWEAKPFAEGIATSSAAAALEVCVEASRTLADADVPHANRAIVAATGGADQWVRRLRFGRQQEAFAQAVRNLTWLERETAGEVLDKLYATPAHITIGDHPASVLLARLRHAMLDGPTVAPTMLRAIHEIRPQMAAELLAMIMDDRHATYVFRGEIQQLQDPVAQSAAARNLARVGVTPGSKYGAWIRPVFDAYIQVMPYISGPRTVLALLRMMATWNQSWGSTAARAVGMARIRGRLRFGRLNDVSHAIELAGTLAALGNEGAAQEILEELLGLDVAHTCEHLDISSVCAAVDISRGLMPDAVPPFARALATAVQSLVARPIILDERAHWQQVGRACRVLRQVGAPAIRVGEPRVDPNMVYAPAVAWAATGLNQPGWGNDAAGRAALWLAERHAWNTADQACVLSATGRGWAPELRTRSHWDVATAPFWLLRILFADEASDPYLTPVLAAAEPAIAERVNADHARADWDASRLRLVLSGRAFARTGSIADDPANLPESR